MKTSHEWVQQIQMLGKPKTMRVGKTIKPLQNEN